MCSQGCGCGSGRGVMCRSTYAENYAGGGTSCASRYGQGLNRMGQHWPNALVPVHNAWINVLGTFIAPTANPRALFNEAAYGGDYPVDRQPEVERPKPWDAFRGIL